MKIMQWMFTLYQTIPCLQNETLKRKTVLFKILQEKWKMLVSKIFSFNLFAYEIQDCFIWNGFADDDLNLAIRKWTAS